MLKLYYAADTCSLASHIALEEAGADYVLARVSFAQNEQRSPEYLAINPKGRVPAMLTDRGILTETPAMLVFIAQSFPQAGLAPLDDPFAFAELQGFNSFLCSTLHVAHAHRMRGHRWADDEAASRPRLERTGTDRLRALRRPEANGRGPFRLCAGARRNLELSRSAFVGPRLFLPERSGRPARCGRLEDHPAAAEDEARGGPGNHRDRARHDLPGQVVLPDRHRCDRAGRHRRADGAARRAPPPARGGGPVRSGTQATDPVSA